MRGLEVTINGEKVCVAGMVEHGLLSASLTWLDHRLDTEHEPGKQTLELDMGAFIHDAGIPNEHLSWPTQPLKVGDVVELRVIEAEQVDEPSERRPDDPTFVDQVMERWERKWYRLLKRKYDRTPAPRPGKRRPKERRQ